METIIVTSCCNCFFCKEDYNDSYCNHPYWSGKGAYENMLSPSDIRNGIIPDKCPLTRGDFI